LVLAKERLLISDKIEYSINLEKLSLFKLNPERFKSVIYLYFYLYSITEYMVDLF
jgi:hypothetical protein